MPEQARVWQSPLSSAPSRTLSDGRSPSAPAMASPRREDAVDRRAARSGDGFRRAETHRSRSIARSSGKTARHYAVTEAGVRGALCYHRVFGRVLRPGCIPRHGPTSHFHQPPEPRHPSLRPRNSAALGRNSPRRMNLTQLSIWPLFKESRTSTVLNSLNLMALRLVFQRNDGHCRAKGGARNVH